MVGVWPVCRCASGGNAGGGVLRLLSAIWCISSVLVNWLSGGFGVGVGSQGVYWRSCQGVLRNCSNSNNLT